MSKETFFALFRLIPIDLHYSFFIFATRCLQTAFEKVEEIEAMQQIIKKIAMVALLSGALTGCAGGGYVAYRAPVPPPPPPGAYVARGYAPGPGYVWVDGYYDWGGSRYVWVPGAWRRPPRPRAYWAPGHFAEHGRRHVWVRGGWRW